jgi:predicted 3-demethylubiquinone-9 3-methyltransferase (glyoxalase superfamily)
MQKITPFLWFDNQAEEAVNFYCEVFAGAPRAKGAKMGKVARYDEAGAKAAGRPVGSLMTASFQLEGQEFIALNGGPYFKFTEAISFVVSCEDQEEIDYYWNKLVDGGQESQCGWLKDKFGLSWQVVPTILSKLLSDPQKSQRTMKAMLPMKKLIIADLEKGAG